jgi:hypothetical protein
MLAVQAQVFSGKGRKKRKDTTLRKFCAVCYMGRQSANKAISGKVLGWMTSGLPLWDCRTGDIHSIGTYVVKIHIVIHSEQ